MTEEPFVITFFAWGGDTSDTSSADLVLPKRYQLRLDDNRASCGVVESQGDPYQLWLDKLEWRGDAVLIKLGITHDGVRRERLLPGECPSIGGSRGPGSWSPHPLGFVIPAEADSPVMHLTFAGMHARPVHGRLRATHTPY